MSLVASVLEQQGIVTVTLSVMPELTARLSAPRTLIVPFGLGSPVGPPGDADTQADVIRSALDLAADAGAAVPVRRVWQPRP